MKNFLLLYGSLLMLLSYSSCAQSPLEEDLQQIEAFLEKTLQQYNVVPGLGVAIVKGQEIIYQGGFGYRDVEKQLPVTAHTGFYLASTTKSLLGMAAARLEHRGLIDLNAPLSTYYPTWDFYPPLQAQDIQLTDLLSHNHNIRPEGISFQLAYINPLPAREMERLFFDFSIPKEDGFRYSNTNFNLMGALLEKEIGKPWQEIIREEILIPLDMKNTTAFSSEALKRDIAYPYFKKGDGFVRIDTKTDGQMHSAGGHFSTPADMARWLLANINGGQLAGQSVLPEPVVQRAHRAYATLDRNFAFFHRHAYGLGWYHSTYEQDTLLHHFGSFKGYMAHSSFMPEYDLGVVVLGNEFEHGGFMPHLAAAYIYDVLLCKDSLEQKYEAILARMQKRTQQTAKRMEERLQEKEALLAKAAEQDKNRQYDANKFVGNYVNPVYGHFKVSKTKDKKLHIAYGPFAAALQPLEENSFVADWAIRNYAAGPEEFTAIYDSEGNVAAFDLQGDEFRRLPLGSKVADLYDIHTAIRQGLKNIRTLAPAQKASATKALLEAHYPSGALTEAYLNHLGYRLLAMPEPFIAIALFEFTSQQYPQSSNAFDSLGEGYLAGGKQLQAIASFKQALQLDPENKNSKAHLERLEQN